MVHHISIFDVSPDKLRGCREVDLLLGMFEDGSFLVAEM